MNFFIAVFALFAVLNSASCDPKVVDPKDIQQCRTETNINEEDLANLKEKKAPETKEGKCFIACVMQKMDVMDSNGLFNLEGAKAATKLLESPDLAAKMNQVSEHCATEVKSKLGSDKCENAAIIAACSQAKKNELGIEV